MVRQSAVEFSGVDQWYRHQVQKLAQLRTRRPSNRYYWTGWISLPRVRSVLSRYWLACQGIVQLSMLTGKLSDSSAFCRSGMYRCSTGCTVLSAIRAFTAKVPSGCPRKRDATQKPTGPQYASGPPASSSTRHSGDRSSLRPFARIVPARCSSKFFQFIMENSSHGD